MPRRKTVDSGPLTAGTEQKAEGSPAVSAKDQYYTGTWAGQPHFECNACAYDTFDEIEMLNHLVDRHNSEQALAVLIALEPPASTPASTTPQTSTAAPLSATGSGEVYEIELKEDQDNA